MIKLVIMANIYRQPMSRNKFVWPAKNVKLLLMCKAIRDGGLEFEH